MKTGNLFLLYIGLMLIITFLQQEFVLLPELINFDLVGEDARMQLLENWHKWRWVSFVTAPTLLLIRLILIALCMHIGSFFFADMSGWKYEDWFNVVTNAQSVMMLYSIVLCLINIIAGADKAQEVTRYTSLLFLSGNNIEKWIRLPLSALNIFEIAYWLLTAKLVSIKTETCYVKSFKFVISSYGVGYLLYIILMMFLILYLN